MHLPRKTHARLSTWYASGRKYPLGNERTDDTSFGNSYLAASYMRTHINLVDVPKSTECYNSELDMEEVGGYTAGHRTPSPIAQTSDCHPGSVGHDCTSLAKDSLQHVKINSCRDYASERSYMNMKPHEIYNNLAKVQP
jgi:hypothetical protein